MKLIMKIKLTILIGLNNKFYDNYDSNDNKYHDYYQNIFNDDDDNNNNNDNN